MSAESRSGYLVIVGGGEDRPGTILEEFVHLAGGPRSRVVVMTLATEHPAETEREYREAFRKLGVDDVCGLDARQRGECDGDGLAAMIERATGVYFTGGDQERIVRVLRGTRLHALLLERFGAGLVIGGTSAGASMMPDLMLEDGESEECPRAGMVELSPGMDFLPGVIVDQHFAQRGRLGRLLAAVAERPDRLGLGIGENTAMIVSGDIFRAIGQGVVTVIDGSHLSYNSLEARRPRQPLTLGGVVVHTVAAGHRFDLRARALLPPASWGEVGAVAATDDGR